MTTIEMKAINAMAQITDNKYTLQPSEFSIHNQGYITFFKLSNGDEYMVKVYDDNSKPKVYKLID